MDTAVAIIGTVVGVVGAAFGALVKFRTTSRGTDHTRIQALEDRVDKLERINRDLWTYNRQLVDHIYRGKPPPPPLPPDAMGLRVA